MYVLCYWVYYIHSVYASVFTDFIMFSDNYWTESSVINI